jgi:hypothetical protein
MLRRTPFFQAKIFPGNFFAPATHFASALVNPSSDSVTADSSITSNDVLKDPSPTHPFIAEFKQAARRAAGFSDILPEKTDWEPCNEMISTDADRRLEKLGDALGDFTNSAPIRFARLATSLLGKDEYHKCSPWSSDAMQDPDLEHILKLLERLHSELRGPHTDKLILRLKSHHIKAVFIHSDIQLLSTVMESFLFQYRYYKSFVKDCASTDGMLSWTSNKKFVTLLNFFINETQTEKSITFDNYRDVIRGVENLDYHGLLFDYCGGDSGKEVLLSSDAKMLTSPTQLNRVLRMDRPKVMFVRECKDDNEPESYRP